MSAPTLSSGTTAASTTSDAAITLIAAEDGQAPTHVMVFNTGAVAGFVSVDAGDNWRYVPANSQRTMDAPSIESVTFKRIPGGSNCTGIYADIW